MFGIIILFVIIGFIVQQRLKSKFKKYSKEALSNGMSGAEIAQKMLEDHFIYDVRIESVAGKLTDHYNPANKTVNLSPEVYSGRSVAAAAVAAHEVGHAVQHAKGYKWLEMRSQLVPMVQFSGKIMNIVIWSMILGVGILRHLWVQHCTMDSNRSTTCDHSFYTGDFTRGVRCIKPCTSLAQGQRHDYHTRAR